jgi:hypothetical protein
MAGTIVANTINTDTGAYLTANALNGVAKAWVNYNAATQTVTKSFNVTSVTYTATGSYVINFPAGVFADANYVVMGMGSYSSGVAFWGAVGNGAVANTTTACALGAYASLNGASLSAYNPPALYLAFFN